jgi:hypothetical protein
MKAFPLILLLACGALCFEDSAKPVETVAEILKMFSDVESGGERATLSRKLFAAASADEIVNFQRADDDSIAIQAAWDAVKLTIPVEMGPAAYRPDAHKLSWFVGFLEGRMRASLPKWWREVVLDVRANRRNNVYSRKPQAAPFHRIEGTDVVCPDNASVKDLKRKCIYKCGQDQIVIPEEILNRTDAGEVYGGVSGYFTKSQCFITQYDDVGYSHTLACIDRATNKLVWQSEVCGCWWGGASGLHESWVTVNVAEDGRVFVFGAASTGIYAHGFRATDGKSLAQFSSNY